MTENAREGNTPYKAEERLEIIRLNIGKTYKELAVLCKCSFSTVAKDMREWRRQGGFEDFLQAEFMELHGIVRNEDPTITYKVIANLLGKTITKRLEAGVTLDIGDQFSALLRDTFGVELKETPDASEDETGKPIKA